MKNVAAAKDIKQAAAAAAAAAAGGEAGRRASRSEFVINGEASRISIARIVGIKIDAVLQKMLKDEMGTAPELGLVIEQDSLEVMLAKPSSLGLHFKLVNRGHQKAESKWSKYARVIPVHLVLDFEDAHKYLYLVASPLKKEEALSWIEGNEEDDSDAKRSEGHYWYTKARYDRNDGDFVSEDFTEYCKYNEVNATTVLLSALRHNRGALDLAVRRSLDFVFEAKESK